MLFEKQQGAAASLLNDLAGKGTLSEKYSIYGSVADRLGVEVLEECIAVAPDGTFISKGGVLATLPAHEVDAVLSMTSVLSIAMSADAEGRKTFGLGSSNIVLIQNFQHG